MNIKPLLFGLTSGVRSKNGEKTKRNNRKLFSEFMAIKKMK